MPLIKSEYLPHHMLCVLNIVVVATSRVTISPTHVPLKLESVLSYRRLSFADREDRFELPFKSSYTFQPSKYFAQILKDAAICTLMNDLDTRSANMFGNRICLLL